MKYEYNENHKEIDGILYKKCAYHKEYFKEEDWFPCNLEYFYKNKSNGVDGLHPECKKCTSKKAKEWEKDNPLKAIESDKRYHRNPHYLEVHRKRCAEIRNLGIMKDWQNKNKDKLKQYRGSRHHKNHIITEMEWENCKKYFDYQCAYCGLPLSKHFKNYKGEPKFYDFHKEHVDDNGKNDLSNCVPACNLCNSSKRSSKLDEWYNKGNNNFTINRYEKIVYWIDDGYFQYLEQ